MKNKLLFLILVIGLCSCSSQTEFPLLDNFKPADRFARGFIDNIIKGQLDSCFADIDAEKLNDTVKTFISNASHNLAGATLKKYKIVQENGSIGSVSNTGKFAYYRLGYEYELDRGYILFTTTISEKNGKYSVATFNGQFLSAPLAELTKFTLTGKSVIQYIFLFFVVLTPIFIFTTLIIMLFSKMRAKKKILWSLMILVVSLPRFVINWSSGQFDFHLIMLGIPGAGMSRATLYSDWLLYFNVPVGAIIFWFKRRSLLLSPTPPNGEREESAKVAMNNESTSEQNCNSV